MDISYENIFKNTLNSIISAINESNFGNIVHKYPVMAVVKYIISQYPKISKNINDTKILEIFSCDKRALKKHYLKLKSIIDES